MAIKEYKNKRSWPETPEPAGGTPGKKELRFVVQMHHASHLHYDFRLEMDGVLRSWAVPKGPSLDPDDKRLAIQVEDHPFDYKDFEGIIPEGNYGAGSVIIWDEGTYLPETKEKGKKAQENLLHQQWEDGSLKFILKGKKLKGAFALIKTKGMGKDAWLLRKHQDKYATTAAVTQKDRSVRSGETVDSIGQTTDRKQTAGKVARSKGKKQQRRQTNNATGDPEAWLDPLLEKMKTPEKPSPAVIRRILSRATDAAFPTKALSPMLATLVDDAFDGQEWEFEVKWDGYRTLAYLDEDEVLLLSRNGKSFTERFAPITRAAEAWSVQAVVDGEIVATNDKGQPEFERLQNWRKPSDGALFYYVFDLLWYQGKDLTQLPLSDRKALLRNLAPSGGAIRLSESIAASGRTFFRAVAKLGLEGMMAKKSDSRYLPGGRSKSWLKIKAEKRQEVVIAGYARVKDSPRPFSSLLLGVYQNGKLQYAGKVGTGFSEQQQQQLFRRLQRLRRDDPPFAIARTRGAKGSSRPWKQSNTTITWLEPRLIAEIKFSEITAEGRFRHPVFIALRDDKSPKAVTAERPDATESLVAASANRDPDSSIRKASLSVQRRPLITGNKKDRQRKINDVNLLLTNLDKVLWPASGYTKGDLIEYYHQVAPHILPFLKDRPQSLNRFPDGITEDNFFQKDVTGKVPDWVAKYPYKVSGERRQKNYMLCNNEAALLYMANLGAIEMNPWSSTTRKPDAPDWCVLDIDPDDTNTFDQVIEVALKLRDLLTNLGVESYCKTSGSTGLHIYIPLAAKYSYDQAQLFAKWLATTANEELPFTSVERRTDQRKGKVYIDYLQNRPAATVAAPYSVRPKPGATVSMPLPWKEVKKGLTLEQFTIETALQKIAEDGDIFRPVLGKGINLKKIFAQLEESGTLGENE